MIKVLNLYAGIGGNRKLWTDVDVTAVEINPEIAKIYQDFFPEDKVVIGDAHQYLLDHYKEFDFIWSSPPCQSHSRTNYFLHARGIIRYPDMSLWQEILFLRTFCNCIWVVENTIPCYEIILNPVIVGRHCFWSNFIISQFKTPKDDIGSMNKSSFTYKLQKANKKPQEQRNAVYSPLGKHIFDCAFRVQQKTLITEKKQGEVDKK